MNFRQNKNFSPSRKKAVPNVPLLAIALIAMTLFGVIAYFVATNEVLTIDTAVRSTIYSWRNGLLTTGLTVITYIGNWQTVTTLCVVTLFDQRTRTRFGVPLAASAICSTILYKAIKTIFRRPRPDLSLHLIVQGGYSFPSGHAMTGLVFYGMAIYLCRKYIPNRRLKNIITVGLSTLIGLIGFSRVYLGVHYPTDILGGWMLGTALLSLFIYLLLRVPQGPRGKPS